MRTPAGSWSRGRKATYWPFMAECVLKLIHATFWPLPPKRLPKRMMLHRFFKCWSLMRNLVKLPTQSSSFSTKMMRGRSGPEIILWMAEPKPGEPRKKEHKTSDAANDLENFPESLCYIRFIQREYGNVIKLTIGTAELVKIESLWSSL